MTLTVGQRIMRRLKLLGGSYTHPDGFIELDFEVEAGIDRNDSEAIKELKLTKHYAKQASRKKTIGAGLVGIACYMVVAHLGMPTYESIAVGVLAAVGLRQLA